MAIDTKAKRLSMMNLGNSVVAQPMFDFTGSISVSDRLHMLGFYSDIIPGIPDLSEGAIVLNLTTSMTHTIGLTTPMTPTITLVTPVEN